MESLGCRSSNVPETPCSARYSEFHVWSEDTDIEAYASVDIPDDHIFIVGPSGGDMRSVAIPGNDFTAHVTSFVDAEPDND